MSMTEENVKAELTKKDNLVSISQRTTLAAIEQLETAIKKNDERAMILACDVIGDILNCRNLQFYTGELGDLQQKLAPLKDFCMNPQIKQRIEVFLTVLNERVGEPNPVASIQATTLVAIELLAKGIKENNEITMEGASNLIRKCVMHQFNRKEVIDFKQRLTSLKDLCKNPEIKQSIGDSVNILNQRAGAAPGARFSITKLSSVF